MASKSVYLETFGCQMNELDSELVAGALTGLGYRFTTAADDADIVLYNTCSVRERAEQKVWSRLGEMKHRKNDQPDLVVGVLGCMAERDGKDLISRMPVVDLMCGPAELDKLPELLDNAVRTKASLAESDPQVAIRRSAKQVALQGNASRRSSTLSAAGDSLESLDLGRMISPVDFDGRRSAYVRITRGCNKFCTYCVVPHTRGAEIHRPPEHIIDEIKALADTGVVEITLLGQTVNHYRFEHDSAVTLDGVVQPQKGRAYKGSHNRDSFAGENTTTFADLLYRIHEEVPAIQRLRFVTSYPRDFGDDVLQVIRDCSRICRFIHVPAQTGSDRMLKMMNRGHTISEYYEFIDRCNEYLHQPEIGRPLMLGGDIIVGFPTETEEDHELTKELLIRSKYKNCFIFKYSPRPGTVAYDKIPDDIPDEIKRRRNNELLDLQTDISDTIAQEQVGGEFDIFVEGLSRREHRKRGTEVKPGSGMVGITIGGADPNATLAVLDQDISEPTVQMSGRTDGDLIVFFDVPTDAVKLPSEYIGQIVRAKITSADKLTLSGELI
ncbi:MAG: radical SAM protein [Phycisphaerales bacterium]|nr:radical SAM protein [Phycisphaerales bacterium]